MSKQKNELFTNTTEESKAFIVEQIKDIENTMSTVEHKNGAEYEDYVYLHNDLLNQYVDLCENESKIKTIDSERRNGTIKTVIYAVGTILSIVGAAALSLLYACIENVGSTGREAKTWLREIWKNRPIFK